MPVWRTVPEQNGTMHVPSVREYFVCVSLQEVCVCVCVVWTDSWRDRLSLQPGDHLVAPTPVVFRTLYNRCVGDPRSHLNHRQNTHHATTLHPEHKLKGHAHNRTEAHTEGYPERVAYATAAFICWLVAMREICMRARHVFEQLLLS